MATVDQIFQQLGLLEWWNARVTQGFGQNGEKGTDFGLGGFGKPVGSLTSGRVVYVGDGGYPGSSIGQIVQVEAPDGKLFHYQHLMTSEVQVGQTVDVGTVLGKGGGCPVGAYPSNLSQSGCTRYDGFSSGQHIEVREADSYSASKGVWSQSWNANNLNIFRQIGGGTATSGAPPGGPGNPGSPGTPVTPLNVDWGSIGVKMGVFAIGLVMILIGLYILFQPQMDAAIGKAVNPASILAGFKQRRAAKAEKRAGEDKLVSRVREREKQKNMTPVERQRAREQAASQREAAHAAEKSQAEAILKKRRQKL